jgi:hypothetical protein
LVDYLGAEVEVYGEVVEIHDFGNGKGVGDQYLGPLRCVGRGRYWAAIGHLLYVATVLEECGGLGCTWGGLHEAAGFAFERRHEGCKVTRLADEPCPRCGLLGGDLQLPFSMGGSVDAMMSRLSEPEFFDHMLDSVHDAQQPASAEV